MTSISSAFTPTTKRMIMAAVAAMIVVTKPSDILHNLLPETSEIGVLAAMPVVVVAMDVAVMEAVMKRLAGCVGKG